MTSLVEMKQLLYHWLIGSLFCSVVIIILLAVSPYVMPAGDAWGLYRYFLNRIAAAAWGIVAITGGALFFDYVTPGNWFEKIEEGNVACAIVTVSIIFTLGLVLCYI